MKIYEVIFFLKKQEFLSKKNNPSRSIYISSAYNNVYKKLLLYDDNTRLTKQIIDTLNITSTMKEKIYKIICLKINKHDIINISHERLIQKLTNIDGIGVAMASKLVKMGLKKITDLNKKKYREHLYNVTITFLKYNPVRQISYSDIQKIEHLLTGFGLSKVVGGFRRKKPFCKDVDVMIVSDDISILDKYINYLKTKFNDIHVYSKGKDKMSLFVNIRSDIYYKVDIFRTSIDHRYAMLLYSTGSKEFNIKMRKLASKMGYLLNQTGIYNKKTGIIVKIKSELDFFNILQMDYVIPEKR